MRTHHTAGTAAVAALLVLTGCAGPDADHAGMSDEGKPTPAHKVVKDTDREAELLAPDASEETATLLLHRWVGAHVRERRTFTVRVVRSEGADTAVCRGTYYADQQTADVISSGTVQSGSWPYTHVECPGPASP
ncbi:hypothetical protein AB0N09_10585 [Streptomyces erythrochromogenes]|uniref:hypothetical protein n=1 Tax=Streptomyces erythrochromogenes TaxID=285574 RepID=UPI00341EBB96